MTKRRKRRTFQTKLFLNKSCQKKPDRGYNKLDVFIPLCNYLHLGQRGEVENNKLSQDISCHYGTNSDFEWLGNSGLKREPLYILLCRNTGRSHIINS